MKKKYFLTYKEDSGGNYAFLLNGENITAEWFNFFSGLSYEQERGCVTLFIKRYAKKLLTK